MSASPVGVFGPPQDEIDVPGQKLMFGREESDHEPDLIVVNPETDTWAPLEETIDVGRAVGCRLRFRDDAFMTRRAARIDPDGPAVIPTDRDAHVWIRVRASTRLRPGDELLIGSTHLVVTTREEAFHGDPPSRH
jgi:hypothetical protein